MGRVECLSDDDALRFASGELDPERAATVTEHLADCEICVSLVAETSRLVDERSGTDDAADALTHVVRGPRGHGQPTLDALAPLVPPAPLAPGIAVGRYEVGGIVGSGGMAVVYEAHDLVLRRRVALKLLHARAGVAPSALLREARAMAQLAHPNVVAVYDAGVHDGQVFVAMELVRGRTLRAWLTERGRTWREAIDVFLQAGAGLAAAHQAGIVHRDFKPENVLLGDDGRARVTDFGLAQPASASETSAGGAGPAITGARDALTTASSTSSSVSASRSTGGLSGTPAYMAPEQLLGAAVDERTDVFAFSVALFEALYGRRPFDGETPEVRFDAVLSGRIAPPADGDESVPKALREVLVRGLAVAPKDRHPSMRALLDDARRAADAVDATPTTTERDAEPTSGRRRGAWAAAAVVLAAALVAATIGLGRRRDARGPSARADDVAVPAARAVPAAPAGDSPAEAALSPASAGGVPSATPIALADAPPPIAAPTPAAPRPRTRPSTAPGARRSARDHGKSTSTSASASPRPLGDALENPFAR